jgi:hypothetical protein
MINPGFALADTSYNVDNLHGFDPLLPQALPIENLSRSVE